MQHDITTNTRFAEGVARLALLAGGWRVHTSDTDEAYDILATDPVNGVHYRIQVKTIRQRTDRVKQDGTSDLVVYAKKGNGEPYMKTDADMIIGVWAQDGVVPRVFMFENREIGEYWCHEVAAAERWVELKITLDRTIFAELAKDIEVVV